MDFHDQQYLQEQFDEAHENNQVYVKVLHYWTFDSEEKRDDLRSFIRYTKQHDGVLYLTVGQFADAYKEERQTRTDDGWHYVPPDAVSPTSETSDTASDTDRMDTLNHDETNAVRIELLLAADPWILSRSADTRLTSMRARRSCSVARGRTPAFDVNRNGFDSSTD